MKTAPEKKSRSEVKLTEPAEGKEDKAEVKEEVKEVAEAEVDKQETEKPAESEDDKKEAEEVKEITESGEEELEELDELEEEGEEDEEEDEDEEETEEAAEGEDDKKKQRKKPASLVGKTIAELNDIFQALMDSEDRMRRKREAESIKSAFYRTLGDVRRKAGSLVDDTLDAIEQNFKALYADYKSSVPNITV